MKKKAIVISIVVILCLSSMLAVVNAQPTNKSCASKSFAIGAGIFLHDESGVTHKHYFDFSILDTNKKNNPEGKFNLICVHGKEIAMIIKSNDITSFNVESVKKGLEATFTGSATVKMDDEKWQKDWQFKVVAFDPNGRNKGAIGITLFNPNDQVHCFMELTPLASGNIEINK